MEDGEEDLGSLGVGVGEITQSQPPLAFGAQLPAGQIPDVYIKSPHWSKAIYLLSFENEIILPSVKVTPNASFDRITSVMDSKINVLDPDRVSSESRLLAKHAFSELNFTIVVFFFA